MTKVSLLYLLIFIINAHHLNMVDFEDFSISGLNSQLIISFLFQVSIHKSSTKRFTWRCGHENIPIWNLDGFIILNIYRSSGYF